MRTTSEYRGDDRYPRRSRYPLDPSAPLQRSFRYRLATGGSGAGRQLGFSAPRGEHPSHAWLEIFNFEVVHRPPLFGAIASDDIAQVPPSLGIDSC